MEKINIAELLKNCPSGMELDCTMYNNVVLEFVSDVKRDTYPIKLKTKKGTPISVTEYGCYDMCADAKCVIFPKGKTSWEGFQRPFKDGDIVYIRDEYSDATFTNVAILKQIEKGGQIYYHCSYDYEDAEFSTEDYLFDASSIRFATEEEKAKLFQAIRANDYKWNPETKTLETLIEFKDGDVIANDRFIAIFHKFKEGHMYYHCWYNNDSNNSKFKIDFGIGYIYEYRLASEEEKEKLFQTIKDNGYEWNSETKTLEELPIPNFKNGDILYCDANDDGKDEDMFKYIFIFDKIVDVDGTQFYYSHCHLFGSEFYTTETNLVNGYPVRFATEKEKQKLFQAIKDNGFRWNEETKTLEKLIEPKFKVGDKIVKKNSVCVPILITKVSDEFYYSNTKSSVGVMSISDQDEYELVPNESEKLIESEFKDGDVIVCENHWGQFISIFKENVTERNGFIGHCVLDVDDNEFQIKDSASYFNKARLAKKREKELLFRAIEKNGYKWNEATKTLEKLSPNKFDINALVPFESKVLVRNANDKVWRPNIFGCYMKDKYVPFYVLGGTGWKQCIPYEGNEHLLCKTDDCNEYFKTWE